MRQSLYGFFALLAIGISTADTSKETPDSRLLPVQRPEHSTDDTSPDNAKELLTTLQELHHSLIAQIAVLENKLKTSLPLNDQAEMNHLVQHYTAQKNNVEREISLIKSIKSTPSAPSAPRHILKTLSAEEKIVPSLLNIFKKPKPSNEQSNEDIAYSHPYSPYYISGFGPQYPYPYYRPPSQPDYPYPNDLIQDTFPGHELQPNPNQVFMNRAQLPQEYQTQPNLPFPQQYAPQPQIMLQPPVQPPLPQPQQPQYQQQPSAQPDYRPQLQAEQQSQFPEINQQQAQFGQKEGVYVFYPNGINKEDEEPERPSIVVRFGQAVDRFGQAISNLAKQTSRGSDGNAAQKSESSSTGNRVRYSRPRSSSDQKLEARELDNKKPKMRWVSV